MSNRIAYLVDARDDLGTFQYERDTLAHHGIDLRLGRTRDLDEIIAAARDAEVLVVLNTRISRELLAALPNCRLVLKRAVGFDNIDVDAATELGIAVTNCPRWCTEEVSDHAAALILAALRKVPGLDHALHSGEWSWQGYRPIHRLRGRTLGLVGFGRIARLTAAKLTGFKFRLLAYDPFLDPDLIRATGAEPADLDAVLVAADIVSVHVPLMPTTRKLLGERELRLMQPGAYLVNTSRGPVLDESAVIRALTEGWIAGAALDVFEEEPLPADSPLRSLPNAILTPHMAAYSEEAFADLGREMCDHAINWFETGTLDTIVNPEFRRHARAGRPSPMAGS